MYNSNVQKIKELYKDSGIVSLFMRLRWAEFLRAPYREIDRLLPKKGTIIDIGSGYGFFSNFLAISSNERNIIGIEYSKQRVEIADKGLKNVKFIYGDVMDIDLAQADAIVIIFMLHHLPSFQAQQLLLKRCYDALNKDGVLIMGEIDQNPKWKFFCSWLVDKTLYFKDKLHFRSSDQFQQLFKDIGFSQIDVLPVDKGIPFSHKVYIGKKT